MSDINFCNTKEQLNHLGEVVTGKVDGSPTGSDIDTSTLPYTGQVRKTLPALEGEYEQSITDKEAEADAAIDSYRLLNKGPYASGITLESKFEYITYNGESYFATNPPYTTTATSPDADGNLFPGDYLTSQQLPLYTDIVYKSSGGNSAVENMIADFIVNPLVMAVGTILKTGGITWEYIDSTGAITLSNFRAFNVLNVMDFGATPTDPLTGLGDSCDAAFSSAYDHALSSGNSVFIPEYWFKFSDDLLVKVNTYGADRDNTVLLFPQNKGATNVIGLNDRYTISKIKDVTFMSDKTSYWNPSDAGDAYVSGITRFDVRNKYGQRVFKGNKTTTPNNILANDPQDQQDGTGFWNKDYLQWMQTDGVRADLSGLPSQAKGLDENVFQLDGRSSIERCRFQGFEKGCVIFGTYEHTLRDCEFYYCNRGLLTTTNAYIGGSGDERITSTSVIHNDAFDCDIAFDLADFGTSTCAHNVIQPAIVAIKYGFGAGSHVHNNYCEIIHTAIDANPNDDGAGTTFERNFTNDSYSRYIGWMNAGINYKWGPVGAGNQKLHIEAAVTKTKVEDGYNLEVSGGLFLRNGNKWKSGTPKDYYIKTLGVSGTSFTITPISLENEILLDLTPLASGIRMWTNTANVEDRTDNIAFDLMDELDSSSYFDPLSASDPRVDLDVIYFNRVSDGSRIDLRDDGVEHLIKITYV